MRRLAVPLGLLLIVAGVAVAASLSSGGSFPLVRAWGVSPEGYIVQCCDCDQDCEPIYSPDLQGALGLIEKCLYVE